MLRIIKYIKENGLAEAIRNFKLKAKIYDNKILLKYNTLESDMSLEEVKECRGLILERDTWEILSYPLYKFFNYGEGNAVEIDLSTAKCLIKEDGTFIHIYWDWNKNEWVAATTGMAEAEGEVNNIISTNFSNLFWETANLDLNLLNKDLNYMFELCTPENIVVTPHTESKIILLAVRNRKTLLELSYDELLSVSKLISVNLVKSIDMNVSSLDEIKDKFEGVPFSEEGYVVMDKNFNRVKIKNPSYVAAHMLKGKTGAHHIIVIIKTNEVDEYIATFPDRREELYRLKASYDTLVEKLEKAWEILETKRPKNITASEKKLYATAVFDVAKAHGLNEFTGLFFALQNEKVVSVKEYVINFDDKRLYKIL